MSMHVNHAAPRRPRSLGHATELALVQLEGVVEELDDHWRVHTPTSPDFYWGNYLLFKHAPRGELDARAWLDRFERLLGREGLRHRLIAWDAPGERGAIEPFLARGFELDEAVILTASEVHPLPRPRPSLEIRALVEDSEWDSAAALQARAFSVRSKDEQATRDFAVQQMRRYRRTVSTGAGQWWGAFLQGRLAGTLGLFSLGDIARFQLVGVDPEFQKQGVAGTLVHDVSARALAAGVSTLVMAADATYHAARVYESVGFCPTERLFAVIQY
jgi:GNAT superfamily N-acetyltransferase